MISANQKRHLRSLAHGRKVVVQSGAAGLTDAVLAEIDRALEAHELVKVRLVTADRDERMAMVDSVCESLGAELVQRVGHVLTVYRKNPDNPKIVLP